MGEQVWVYVGGTVIAVTAVLFAVCLIKGRWAFSAFIVGLAHMGVVWINAAAPFRGLLDPEYVGYANGFLRASPGLDVTLLAGSLVGCGLAGAMIAALNAPGKRMVFVTGTSVFFGWSILFPTVADLIRDPNQVAIQLGEFLTIPPLVTIPLLLLLFVGPFAYGARWSWRRAFA
jgi:hypothetical protein